eukprot:UC4_evm1s399
MSTNRKNRTRKKKAKGGHGQLPSKLSESANHALIEDTQYAMDSNEYKVPIDLCDEKNLDAEMPNETEADIIERLTLENKDLRNELVQLKRSLKSREMANAEEVSGLEAEISRLEEELRLVSEKTGLSTTGDENVENLRKQLKARNAEILDLKERINIYRTSSSSESQPLLSATNDQKKGCCLIS